MEAPQNPAGPFEPEEHYGPERRAELIGVLERAPAALRDAVRDLTDAHLETRYRNWTVRQIVHHIADSHINAYVRFKLALTEEHPTIKPYDEGKWVLLEDGRREPVETSLVLVDSLHRRWVRLLKAMTDEHFSRTFYHPEWGAPQTLRRTLAYYAWHSRHHTGQILWLRQHHGW